MKVNTFNLGHDVTFCHMDKGFIVYNEDLSRSLRIKHVELYSDENHKGVLECLKKLLTRFCAGIIAITINVGLYSGFLQSLRILENAFEDAKGMKLDLVVIDGVILEVK